MNKWLFPIAFVVLVAAAPQPSWPDTPAGSMARQWVEAFPSEPAMRAFLIRNVDEQDLKKRSLDDRLNTYRESRKKFGTLTFVSIVSSKPEELQVTLASAKGEKMPFTFTVKSAPPHKLLSITRSEMQMHGHGLGWLLPGH